MVCSHCPTPIPKPISMEMDPIIMCRTVSTEPTPIPILIPVLIPMATVPNLVLISVPIWWNLLIFIVTLHQYHHWLGHLWPPFLSGGGASLILGPFSGRGWVCPECTDWPPPDMGPYPPPPGRGIRSASILLECFLFPDAIAMFSWSTWDRMWS